mgnify:FL=1
MMAKPNRAPSISYLEALVIVEEAVTKIQAANEEPNFTYYGSLLPSKSDHYRDELNEAMEIVLRGYA